MNNVHPVEHPVEHPFAPYIRALGKGRNGTRALSEDEAFEAMRMILAGEAEPMQIGAFLMLMRVKEETAAELAGFARAAQASIALPPQAPAVRLDWPAYAGKRRQLPWFVLSALLLAAHGMPVLMHGSAGFDPGRVFVPQALDALGVAQSRSLGEAAQRIATHRFAFIALADLSPAQDRLMQLRPLLGLRSPVHSVVRMLNPLRARAVLQGIFHPGYADIHQGAASLLGIGRTAVFKGEGGEAERNPDGACVVRSVIDGHMKAEEWPPMFDGPRHLRDEAMDVRRLAAVWRGECADEYGEAAVIGSAAIALRTLGKATTVAAAEVLARELWHQRASAGGAGLADPSAALPEFAA